MSDVLWTLVALLLALWLLVAVPIVIKVGIDIWRTRT